MPNAYDNLAKALWKSNPDPLLPGLFEGVMKQDAHNVGAIDHWISKAFGGDGSTVIGDESRKVENDPVRGLGRAALVAGGVFAAPYVMGAGGGGAAGGTAGGAAGAGAAGGAGIGSAGAGGATNAALIDSYLGTAGYGASSAGAGGGAGAVAGAGTQYRMPQMAQGQQQQPTSSATVGDPFAQQKKEALILALMEAQRRKSTQDQFSGGNYG